MNTLSPLLTDLYQLTMAQGYWRLGRAEQPAVFQLTFRKHPFQGNYTVACGLTNVIEFLQNYRFTKDDLNYLGNLKNNDDKAIFGQDFLDYLSQLRFSCDIDGVPEGTLVFPQEPLLRIQGPLLQCQLIETTLLNLLNFSSLVATSASRICQITQDDPVMEFGLRRAQGPDGGMTASRSSYIGGCDSTSNVLAGKTYGIPVKGTVAHSWIMSYDDELTAFQELVKASDNTTLLVDTYDSIQGIKNAIIIGKQLRQAKRDLFAVRLDSGDLLKLSKQARRLLDQAGFKNTKIIGSGDLNVEKIKVLKKNKAPIDMWGVGTKLVTAYEQPSLDAIYKLTALYENGRWQYKMKLSDAPEKMTYPGIQQVRRYFHKEKMLQDIIYDTQLGIAKELPNKANRFQDLVVPIFREGKLVYQQPSLQKIREFCLQQVKVFTQLRLKKYSVKLEKQLNAVKNKLTRDY
jgi:nicotinate phosphoribosyltransferase